MKESADIKDFKAAWSYEPAPESIDHIQLKKQYDLFIDGSFVPPLSKKYFDTINPASHTVISKVAEASDQDVDKAVNAAEKAFKKWSALPEKKEENIFLELPD